MKSNIVITRSAAELADVLNLSPTQAADFELRSELCRKLIAIVKRDHLTHAYIARAAGTSRTRVTAILNRNLQGVSTDLLLRIVRSLGYQAKIILTKVNPAA
jgi:predicted XRE-type DNA-binding protein